MLTVSSLTSIALQSLKSKLDVLGMPTDQLIIQFYSDFLKQQEQSKAVKFGELILSTGFIKELSAIEVNIVHGEHMGKSLCITLSVLPL